VPAPLLLPPVTPVPPPAAGVPPPMSPPLPVPLVSKELLPPQPPPVPAPLPLPPVTPVPPPATGLPLSLPPLLTQLSQLPPVPSIPKAQPPMAQLKAPPPLSPALLLPLLVPPWPPPSLKEVVWWSDFEFSIIGHDVDVAVDFGFTGHAASAARHPSDSITSAATFVAFGMPSRTSFEAQLPSPRDSKVPPLSQFFSDCSWFSQIVLSFCFYPNIGFNAHKHFGDHFNNNNRPFQKDMTHPTRLLEFSNTKHSTLQMPTMTRNQLSSAIPQPSSNRFNVLTFFLVFLLYSLCFGFFEHGLFRKWTEDIFRIQNAMVNHWIYRANNFSHLIENPVKSAPMVLCINSAENVGFGRFFETFVRFGQNYLIWKPGLVIFFIPMAYFVRFCYGSKMFVSLNVFFFCKQGQKFASSNLTSISPIWTLQEGAWAIPMAKSPTISNLETFGHELIMIQLGELPTHQNLFSLVEFFCRFLFGRLPFRLPSDKTEAKFEPLDFMILDELRNKNLISCKTNLELRPIKVWKPHEKFLDHAGALQDAFKTNDPSRFFTQNPFCRENFILRSRYMLPLLSSTLLSAHV
jgi:hypothetical protein